MCGVLSDISTMIVLISHWVILKQDYLLSCNTVVMDYAKT